MLHFLQGTSCASQPVAFTPPAPLTLDSSPLSRLTRFLTSKLKDFATQSNKFYIMLSSETRAQRGFPAFYGVQSVANVHPFATHENQNR